MTRKDHDKNIIMRVKEDSDSVIPSAGSVAVLNLLRLTRFTDTTEYAKVAESTLKSILSRIKAQPDLAPNLLIALNTSRSKPAEVVIVGDRNKEDTCSILKTINSLFIPGKIVMLVDNNTTRSRLARYLPFIEAVKKMDNRATAYVCTDKTCKQPVTDSVALTKLLN